MGNILRYSYPAKIAVLSRSFPLLPVVHFFSDEYSEKKPGSIEDPLEMKEGNVRSDICVAVVVVSALLPCYSCCCGRGRGSAVCVGYVGCYTI
eukprot:6173366-Pleurochrysis_carterae.AAC.3